MSNILRASWSRLVTAFGAALERLEPWRKYHTVQHLEECLGWFDATCHLAEQPAEVEAALWFHDAVYEASRHDNEEQSAKLAESSLIDAGATSQRAARVAGLVLATQHTALPSTADEQPACRH